MIVDRERTAIAARTSFAPTLTPASSSSGNFILTCAHAPRKVDETRHMTYNTLHAPEDYYADRYVYLGLRL
jgi:hypothetical protein